jgi:hypothetical protein
LSDISETLETIWKSLQYFLDSIKDFWESYPLIFIGAIIMGIVFAIRVNSKKEKKD